MFCNLLGEQLGQGCCASFPPTAFVSSSKKAADDLAISENSLKKFNWGSGEGSQPAISGSSFNQRPPAWLRLQFYIFKMIQIIHKYFKRVYLEVLLCWELNIAIIKIKHIDNKLQYNSSMWEHLPKRRGALLHKKRLIAPMHWTQSSGLVWPRL